MAAGQTLDWPIRKEQKNGKAEIVPAVCQDKELQNKPSKTQPSKQRRLCASVTQNMSAKKKKKKGCNLKI